MRLFNKKTIAKVAVIFSLFFIVGCSSQNKTSNKDANNTKNQSENVDSNKTTSSNTTQNSDSESNTPQDTTSQNELLENIKTLAADGKIINCDYPVKTSNIYTIEDTLGKADSSNWVTSAKGMYSTYSKHNVVFGSNKGGRVFEVRSLDSRLNKISLSMVKKKFGTPQHDVKTGGEEIIGYVISKDFKILFVFPEPTTSTPNPFMSHYSVLYPAATVNSMASDPGRQW